MYPENYSNWILQALQVSRPDWAHIRVTHSQTHTHQPNHKYADGKHPTNPSVLLCFIDPRVRKIRNKASSGPGIFSRTLRFGCAASGGALAPEPATRLRGRTRVPTDFSSLLSYFTRFFLRLNVFTRERDNVVYWKTKRKINDDLQYICLSSDTVSDLVSDLGSPISERGDVRSQKR